MAINFPSNPSLDQVYTFDNRSWKWNGEYWQSITVTTGYTGSQGDPGNSVRLLGSVDTIQDLPSDGTSDGSTLLLPGDGFLVLENGNMYLWDGSSWSNIGKITGEIGPIGYTGSVGFTGSIGFTGSQGESSFSWGPTPPENPEVGARWYDTTAGILVVYVDDGNSLQWVETNSSGFLGRTGYTGSQGSGQMYGTAEVKSIFYSNKQISENITISSEHNAGSFGPVEIAQGYTVELQANATWTIV